MPSGQPAASEAVIEIVVEFPTTRPEHVPFSNWRALKDYARAALPDGEPSFTEMKNPSVDGRSIGYVICKNSADARLVYSRMLQLYQYNAIVHWYDSTLSRPDRLQKCNCVGGHGSTTAGYTYNRYRGLIPEMETRPTNPVTVGYPQQYPHATAGADPVQAITGGFQNMSMSSAGPSQFSAGQQYPSQFATAYSQAPQYPGMQYTSSIPPDYAVQTPNYPQYSYPPGFAMSSSVYTNQPAATPGVENWSNYQTQQQNTHGYTHALATAGYGQSSTSPSYVMNSSGLPVNTTKGYIRTERNTVMLKNLHPNTTEKDIEHQIKRVGDGITAKHIKLNKYEHHKKRSINAAITFENWDKTKAVKEFFELRKPHIKNREVSVSYGKDSAPPGPPIVVSSTLPNQ